MIDPVTAGAVANVVAPIALEGFKQSTGLIGSLFNSMSNGNRRRWARNHPEMSKYYATHDPEFARFVAQNEPALFQKFASIDSMTPDGKRIPREQDATSAPPSPGVPVSNPQNQSVISCKNGVCTLNPQAQPQGQQGQRSGDMWNGYGDESRQLPRFGQEQVGLQNEYINRLMKQPEAFQNTPYAPATAFEKTPYTPTPFEKTTYTPTDLKALETEEIGRFQRELLPQVLGQAFGNLPQQSGSHQNEMLRGVTESLTERLNAMRAKNELQQNQFGANFAAKQNMASSQHNAGENQFRANLGSLENRFQSELNSRENQFGANMASNENRFKHDLAARREATQTQGAMQPRYENIYIPGQTGFKDELYKELLQGGVAGGKHLASKGFDKLMEYISGKGSSDTFAPEGTTNAAIPGYNVSGQYTPFSLTDTSQPFTPTGTVNTPISGQNISGAYTTYPRASQSNIGGARDILPELSQINTPYDSSSSIGVGRNPDFGKFLKNIQESKDYTLGGRRK